MKKPISETYGGQNGVQHWEVLEKIIRENNVPLRSVLINFGTLK